MSGIYGISDPLIPDFLPERPARVGVNHAHPDPERRLEFSSCLCPVCSESCRSRSNSRHRRKEHEPCEDERSPRTNVRIYYRPGGMVNKYEVRNNRVDTESVLSESYDTPKATAATVAVSAAAMRMSVKRHIPPRE